MSAGSRFRQLLTTQHPLPIAGAIHAYAAMQAQQAGFQALYLSGAGVANASYGLPDLGFTHLDDVLIDAKRILRAVDLPLLVDADTGFEDPAETVRALESVGAAGLHIEDQQDRKRCGHRPGKFLISTREMVDRLASALSARKDKDFIIMARSDALADEGLAAVIARCKAYIEAGADMIFVDAVETPEQYQALSQALAVPILANITEFGKTPILSQDELKQRGVAMALYPLSAFRAMSLAAQEVYESIIQVGSQETVLNIMQTRDELYRTLDYYRYEDEQTKTGKE
jgi:methylisocitrate lyase